MKKLIENIEVGKSYTYPNGLTFIILKEDFSLNRKAFEIEFEKTHTKKVYSKTALEFGKCFDYNSPSLLNKGVIGENMTNQFSNISQYKFYHIWSDILNRCYNLNKSDYIYYGAQGVKVCEDWLYLENFYNWYIKQDGYNKDNYQIDKDLIALANHKDESKVYSPETCLLIPKELNRFFITYKDKNSNIRKNCNGYQASVHFGSRMIRSLPNLTFEEAQKEKIRIKKACFLELNENLKLNDKLYNLCLKIFE